MSLYNKLAALRKEKNISQEKLSEIIGVSRQSVAKWESGDSMPEIEKLILISDFFKASIDSLVKDSGPCAFPDASDNKASGYEGLTGFLLRAKKATYAGHGAETASSRLNSHDLTYAENDFLYYDTYLGGERFAGEEAVWIKGIPAWTMNYAGRVLHESFSGEFLKEALGLVVPEHPYRGPLLYSNDGYTYHCGVNGNFDWYDGKEEIFAGQRKVYECVFHGGLLT
jgi:transcriptional regulator with XRE-family HTH domain